MDAHYYLHCLQSDLNMTLLVSGFYFKKEILHFRQNKDAQKKINRKKTQLENQIHVIL